MKTKLNKFLQKNAIFTKPEASILMKQELDEWGILKDSLFYKVYGAIALFPAGNSVNLFSLGEVQKVDSLLLIGDDELGLLVYDSSSDSVYEYDFDAEKSSDHYLESLRGNYLQKWDSFELFLKNYYELEELK